LNCVDNFRVVSNNRIIDSNNRFIDSDITNNNDFDISRDNNKIDLNSKVNITELKSSSKNNNKWNLSDEKSVEDNFNNKSKWNLSSIDKDNKDITDNNDNNEMNINYESNLNPFTYNDQEYETK